jgi:hypothetical protein
MPLPEQCHPEAENNILDVILNIAQLPSEEISLGPMAYLVRELAQSLSPLDEMVSSKARLTPPSRTRGIWFHDGYISGPAGLDLRGWYLIFMVSQHGGRP